MYKYEINKKLRTLIPKANDQIINIVESVSDACVDDQDMYEVSEWIDRVITYCSNQSHQLFLVAISKAYLDKDDAELFSSLLVKISTIGEAKQRN